MCKPDHKEVYIIRLPFILFQNSEDSLMATVFSLQFCARQIWFKVLKNPNKKMLSLKIGLNKPKITRSFFFKKNRFIYLNYSYDIQI